MKLNGPILELLLSGLFIVDGRPNNYIWCWKLLVNTRVAKRHNVSLIEFAVSLEPKTDHTLRCSCTFFIDLVGVQINAMDMLYSWLNQ